MSDDTLTIGKLREAIKKIEAALGPPPPDFIVSLYVQSPLEYQGTMFLSPDNAKELHAKAPLILRQVLSRTSGRYSIATPFDGLFPAALPVPPFDDVAQ